MFDGVPIVNGAFSQSSLLLNRVLFEVVHSLVGRPASLLDLYCGSGNLSLGWAHEGIEVLGIDRDRAAVTSADAVGPGTEVGGEDEFLHAMDQREAILPIRRGRARPSQRAWRRPARVIGAVRCGYVGPRRRGAVQRRVAYRADGRRRHVPQHLARRDRLFER